MKGSPDRSRWARGVTRPWLRVVSPVLLGIPAMVLVSAGCSDFGPPPPTGPRGVPSVGLELTLELDDGLPTFKVDGRVRLIWEFADQPVGGRDLGIVVLPAGERRATIEIDVPTRPGRLVGREETVNPRLPFLCGSTDVFDPRGTDAATLTLDLCLSESE